MHSTCIWPGKTGLPAHCLQMIVWTKRDDQIFFKKEAISDLNKVFKSSHSQNHSCQKGHLTRIIGPINEPQSDEISHLRVKQWKIGNFVQIKNASTEERSLKWSTIFKINLNKKLTRAFYCIWPSKTELQAHFLQKVFWAYSEDQILVKKTSNKLFEKVLNLAT